MFELDGCTTDEIGGIDSTYRLSSKQQMRVPSRTPKLIFPSFILLNFFVKEIFNIFTTSDYTGVLENQFFGILMHIVPLFDMIDGIAGCVTFAHFLFLCLIVL